MDSPTLPVHTPSEVLGDFEATVRFASENHQAILIKGEGQEAVLIPKEDWQAMQETLYLMSIPEMRESLLEAKATPTSEFSDRIEW